MGDKPIWKLRSGDWVQDDEKKRFDILDRETGKIQNNQLGLDIISGAKWHRATESDCGGFFPTEFDHCPFCGINLVFGENHNFSVPIVDAGRHVIYWIGLDGLLTFNLTNRSCGWRPWETDAFPCIAVPELGTPYRDTFGNFWQICYDRQDDAFRYYKLSGNESDREDVDGGRFSSGLSCFSKPYDLWEKPWAKVDTKRYDKAKFIRAPLLCLDEESKTSVTVFFGKGVISPLLEIVRDRGKTYQATLRIESPSDLPIELRMHNAFNLQTPWEPRLFVYQNYLFAYSIEGTACYKWRLK